VNDLAVAESPYSAEDLAEQTGQNVFLCYGCKKCTAGCPMAERMDLEPNQVLRAVQLGLADIALKSRTIWLCLSCAACSARCPQGIDLVKVMDALRAAAITSGVEPPIASLPLFHQTFLKWIDRAGRMYEAGLLADLKFRLMSHGDLDFAGFERDAAVGVRMFLSGKIKPLPSVSLLKSVGREGKSRVDAVGYYPGCSLHSSAVEFDRSTRAVTDSLGIHLEEVPGWTCCGASSAHAVDERAAILLPVRNLARAQDNGYYEVTTPCAMCFSRLRAASKEMNENTRARQIVTEEMGEVKGGTVKVSHLLDTIIALIGMESIRSQVRLPLDGLRVACYYGCLLTRPTDVACAEHPEYPMKMDILTRSLGAEAVDWSYKTECCGASMALTDSEIVLDLTRKILKNAKEEGAEAIVVGCPLCHVNLDTRQSQVEARHGERYALPIFYFTELMGLALGLPSQSLDWKRHLTDPGPLLLAKRLVSSRDAARSVARGRAEDAAVRGLSGLLAVGRRALASRSERP
jgi:heterodisulfide reductase subunit B2